MRLRRLFGIGGWLALAMMLLTGTSSATTGGLAGCFGHNGVQFGSNVAYECIFTPNHDGGALYWSANVNALNWDKHPAGGLLWVEATTILASSTSNPANPYDSFTAEIAGPGGACEVVDPGYGDSPTMCRPGNGTLPPVTMTAQQQASYNGFAEAMTQANVPDSAWSN
jgi:hypothetical protein